MRKRSPEVPVSPPSQLFSGYFYGICALCGLVLALALFLVFHYADSRVRERQVQESCLQSLSAATADMEQTWKRAQAWGDQIAWQLGAADKASIPTLLAQYQRLWPEAGFTLFDQSALPMPVAASSLASDPSKSHLADLPGLKTMVLKALDGETSRDYTRFRGFLSLGVATPVQGRQVRAVVISVPLDSFYMQEMKGVANANIAVVPLDDRDKKVLGDISNAWHTFNQNSHNPANLQARLRTLLQEKRLAANEAVLLHERSFSAGVHALMSADGSPMGLLVVAPVQAADSGIPLWRYYASLGGGLAAALILGALLRFREKRTATALAGDLYALARDAHSRPQHLWPTSLNGAFAKIAVSLQEYKLLLKNASGEHPQKKEHTGLTEEACKKMDTGEYQRLFDNLPVGAFQAEISGRFLRINSAFAMLLGYESPMGMMAQCDSFSDLCLYGEGIRNPIKVIMKQGGGRHILFLRRQDGKVKQFAVICTPLTSGTGDEAGVIEGFLLDRELEERLAATERESDEVKKERESLALLLAATCRQTRSYFTPPQVSPSPQTDAEHGQPEKEGRAQAAVPSAWPEFKELSGPAEFGEHPDSSALPEDGDELEERLERRKSVLSIKAVLNDIYQIAMTEVDGTPPLDVPMEFRHFMKRLCRQALPNLFSRGISLRCEIAEELLLRMSGPAPLLRHALLRSLMAVTGTAQEGWACLSVTRDPNSPRLPGISRLIFSTSWSSAAREEKALDAPEKGYAVFVAEADPDMPASFTRPTAGTLDISEEQSIIRYLAQKMRGELLEGVLGKDLRSFQMVVPLDHLNDPEEYGRSEPAVSGAGDSEQVEDLTRGADAIPPAAKAFTEDRMPADIWVQPPASESPAPLPDSGAGMMEGRGPEVPDAALAEEAGLTEEPQPTSLNLLVMENESPGSYSGGDAYSPVGGGIDEEEEEPAQSLDILLIDGSLNNRLLFSLFLRETRHRITEAHDGQEGVEAFQRGRYDVIFMDMEMPLMDGYQATRIIRALEADKGQEPIPIVGMTTYALPELRRECMLSGCTEFLSRPFSKNTLLTLLKAFARLKSDSGPVA